MFFVFFVVLPFALNVKVLVYFLASLVSFMGELNDVLDLFDIDTPHTNDKQLSMSYPIGRWILCGF